MKLTVRETAVFGMLGALMYASKMLMKLANSMMKSYATLADRIYSFLVWDITDTSVSTNHVTNL